MSEKGIIFSTPIIPALLNTKPGTWPAEPIDPFKPFKWMDRRVAKIKRLPSSDSEKKIKVTTPGLWLISLNGKPTSTYSITPYQRGDILWVRETWQENTVTSEKDKQDMPYFYKADPDGVLLRSWIPSTFMPREASRISLEVKAVRIEQLQDITEEDAIAEGAAGLWDEKTDTQWKEYVDRLSRNGNPLSSTDKHAWGYKNYLWHGHFGKHGLGDKKSDSWEYQLSAYDTARGSFSSLWELINARRGYSWESNPYVFVYEFMRVK
jgi:hypothetical protein